MKAAHRRLVFLLGLVLAAGASSLVAGGGTGTFSVRDYGAVGDGKALDTGAIDRAIEAAAAAGGGMVIFPAGTYASYSIHLKSHVALYLGSGATVLAADPPAEGQPGGYDAPEANPWAAYQDFGHSHWHNSLIWGEDLEDIAILGPGRIYGRGLSRGATRRAPGVGELVPESQPHPAPSINGNRVLEAGVGNKAIALKNCRNVILRDFTVLHGGHFAVLATGVDNWTCDNLKIDTNRDGIDFDCCQNVRVSNCTVNSPFDDGICPKSSFGLGYRRLTENLTIINCQVSGYDEGTLLDGTRQRKLVRAGGPIGRIKLGTESNGGFRNITISNCVFEYCRGLALESVDGAILEDITVSNLTMRDIVNAPVFIRLGARLRGPAPIAVGVCRRIKLDTIIAHNVAAESGILISGIPGHPIEDLTISNVLIDFAGGGTKAEGSREVPEYEQAYPEPTYFGRMPAWGLFARHVSNLSVDRVELRAMEPDLRPTVILHEVEDATFDVVRLAHGTDAATFVLKDVTGFSVHRSRGLPEIDRAERVSAQW